MLNTLTRTPASAIGPTLVFLHYYGGSIRAWSLVVEQLADEFSCLILDLPGFGESAPLSSHQSVDEVAALVAEGLTAQLNGQPYILVGHSMGGKIALAIAAGQPDQLAPVNLRGLLLLATSPPSPEPIPDADRQDMLDQPGLAPDEQRQAAQRTASKITKKPLTDTLFQQIIDDNLRSSPEGWVAWAAVGSRDDITSRMACINVPVALLAGDEDQAIPHSVQAERVQSSLPQATLQTVHGAGHLLPLETPNVVIQAIREFIRQVK